MISRRGLLKSFGLGTSAALLGGNHALAQFGALDAVANGLIPGTGSDVSAQFSQLIEHASLLGQPLYLAAGDYIVSDVKLPTNAMVVGARGQTKLIGATAGPILLGRNTQNISLEHLTFNGANQSGNSENFGLLDLVNCERISLTDCQFESSSSNGVSLYGSSGTIAQNRFSSIENAAIASTDATGLSITDNTIDGCGNNGILVWRNDNGHDGSIVSGNQIKNIDWRNGGNGQNGNGINVFRAADVIISNNVITDCAFSAIRANGSVNCQILGNNCRDLSEIAIFSEFDFSGSIIAQNIIDGTAQGISITNWNDGGHLAVCANNIVRNVWKSSPTNPDTSPVGIALEADIVADGNVVENVPGTGIAVGWGPYMRNVSVTNNLIREVEIGVYVSVVDGVGAAQVKNNQIDKAKTAAIVGAQWADLVDMDLTRTAGNYPLLQVSGNQTS